MNKRKVQVQGMETFRKIFNIFIFNEKPKNVKNISEIFSKVLKITEYLTFHPLPASLFLCEH
jgi:hypothetical protein